MNEDKMWWLITVICISISTIPFAFDIIGVGMVLIAWGS